MASTWCCNDTLWVALGSGRHWAQSNCVMFGPQQGYIAHQVHPVAEVGGSLTRSLHRVYRMIVAHPPCLHQMEEVICHWWRLYGMIVAFICIAPIQTKCRLEWILV